MKHDQLGLSRHFDERQIVPVFFAREATILSRDGKVAWRKGKVIGVLLEIQLCTSNRRNACSLLL